jgi:hypothetical protein
LPAAEDANLSTVHNPDDAPVMIRLAAHPAASTGRRAYHFAKSTTFRDETSVLKNFQAHPFNVVETTSSMQCGPPEVLHPSCGRSEMLPSSSICMNILRTLSSTKVFSCCKKGPNEYGGGINTLERKLEMRPILENFEKTKIKALKNMCGIRWKSDNLDSVGGKLF